MTPIMELRDYFMILRRRAWIIALVVVLAVGGAVYALASQPPQYEAEASMLVTPRVLAPTAIEDSGIAALQSAYSETILNNIMQLLKSRTLLQRVADRVGMSPGTLARSVTVKDIRGTDFLLISARAEQPTQAALIANTMAQELGEFYAQINRTEASSARKFLEEQLSIAQGRLGTGEQALLEFQTRTGTVALSDEASRTVQRILDLQAAYDAATLDNRIAQTRVAAIQSRLRAQNDGRLATVSIATNPVIAQIRDHLTGLELELANLRQVYTDQHPKVQAMQGRIAEDRQRMNAEAAKVLTDQSLGISPIREQFVREMITGEVDAAAARARAAGIVPILGKMQARLNGVPKNELTLARLQRDVRIAEQLFTRLSSLHQEAVIRENKATSAGQAAIMVVDHARTPERPIANQLPKMATFAGLLALFVGVAMALAVESLDDRVRSPKQAEGAYGVPVLAAIPTMNSKTYRHLTAAPGITSILFPAILVLLVLGLVAGLYVVRVGATPVTFAHFSQALLQAFHTVR